MLLPHPVGMEIDWTRKLRPRPGKVKIIEREAGPASGTLRFADRAELYEVLAGEPPRRER